MSSTTIGALISLARWIAVRKASFAASSSLKLIDYATGRVRAGYAFGQFLPYGAAGIAVGQHKF